MFRDSYVDLLAGYVLICIKTNNLFRITHLFRFFYTCVFFATETYKHIVEFLARRKNSLLKLRGETKEFSKTCTAILISLFEKNYYKRSRTLLADSGTAIPMLVYKLHDWYLSSTREIDERN